MKITSFVRIRMYIITGHFLALLAILSDLRTRGRKCPFTQNGRAHQLLINKGKKTLK